MESRSKKTTILIGVCIAIVIIGAIGVTMAVKWMQGQEMQKKEKAIESFSQQVAHYAEEIRAYCLDHDIEDYMELRREANQIIEEKDIKRQQEILDAFEALSLQIEDWRKEEVEEQFARIKEISTEYAYDEELELIEKLKKQVEENIGKSDYLAASETLKTLNEKIEKASVICDNLSIQINQVDTSEYPKIKLYLNIKDSISGKVPSDIEGKFFFLSEKLAKDSEYIKKEIQKVTQLNEAESLNINMVADVSGSMQGEPLASAKLIMSNFLENVQFGIGDEVELNVFSNGVYTAEAFTSDKAMLVREIEQLTTGDMTSLYDALYAATNRTAIQNGAKCVIAFTDGQDNYSSCSASDVIDVAKRYNIPIFIIGVGSDIEEGVLSNIAESTNGFYSNVNNMSDMADVYNTIYRQQKELYMLEYEITEPDSTFDTRNLKVEIQTREIGGACTYDYMPKILLSAEASLGADFDIDNIVGKYLNGFVNAINSHDYSYLQPYVVEGGPLYKEVHPYIQKDIKETLLSYEIVNKEYIDDAICIVTVHEIYEVLNQEDPLHMRTLESQYVLKKQSDKWQFYAFNTSISILSKINS